MKVTSYGLAVLLGVVIGLGVASWIYRGDTTKTEAQLKQLLEKRQQKLDSLAAVTRVQADSLKAKHEVTTKEKIKYYAIKPKPYTSAKFDSLLRARYH
jgi:hypothetical protein